MLVHLVADLDLRTVVGSVGAVCGVYLDRPAAYSGATSALRAVTCPACLAAMA